MTKKTGLLGDREVITVAGKNESDENKKEVKESKPNVIETESKVQALEVLTILNELMSDEYMTNPLNKKNVQTYTPIHKMLELLKAHKNKNIIKFVNETLYEALKKEGIADVYKMLNPGKLE